MQKNNDAGDESTHTHDRDAAEGLLEGAGGVDQPYLELDNQGTVVARLYGMQHAAGALVFPAMPGSLWFRDEVDCVLKAEVYSARRLRWSHAGAMRLLHGVVPPAILGTNWVMLSGAATAAGDPRPGIAKPILLKVLENPANYPPDEVFKIAYRELGLQA